jgi:hypothetical protein
VKAVPPSLSLPAFLQIAEVLRMSRIFGDQVREPATNDHPHLTEPQAAIFFRWQI